ncbi:MAG: NAD(P)-binding domain-containing protein, partial [Syntrophomonadaceae bacterium]|nr:NAD(P)-binding domain-containing protein [Syntrophomonadaceae bacterium]
MPKTFGVIGCGKMAYALIKGIQNMEQPLFGELFGNDVLPERIELFKKDFHMNYLESAEELFAVSDVLLLAVKPQQIAEVLQKGRGIVKRRQLIISIAAGIKIETIEKELPEAAVIRVMPNTPCMVGEG